MEWEGFRVLDAANREESEAWLELWREWPDHEPFGHPSYAALFARQNDHVVCPAWRSDKGRVIFPLIQRPLGVEPWARLDNRSDLTSPYGYGGAFTWGEVDEKSYWNSFEAWAQKAGVVACFLRLSLWPEQILEPPRGIDTVSLNVAVNLTPGPEVIWRGYKHKVRKNVNRALRDGLETEIDCNGERLSEFLEVYYDTMQRREADKRYFFQESFFHNLCVSMPGCFAFFHTLAKGRVVSSELVLVSKCHVYSFLGGTLQEWFESRPNDLLKHRIIEWAYSQGKTAFVLGGGYKENDGVFNYKKAFAPQGTVPFRVCKLILDEVCYYELIEGRRNYEKLKSVNWTPVNSYFPAYRS